MTRKLALAATFTLCATILAACAGSSALPEAISEGPEGIVECETVGVRYFWGDGIRTESEARQLCVEADDDRPPPVAPTDAPVVTTSQANAIRSAQNYLDFTHFSRQGLIDQLSSEFGDQFSLADATFAVSSLTVDWNEQAAGKAQDYLDFSAFSCQGLIDQMSSEFGDKFTQQEARYGATAAGLC